MSNRTRWIIEPALALTAGLLVGPAPSPRRNPRIAQANRPKPPAPRTRRRRPSSPRPKVAVFRLAGPVGETPKEEIFNFGGDTGISLETLVSRMDKAAKDSAVKAVVILLDQATVGTAQVEEVRQAIARLRAAGRT